MGKEYSDEELFEIVKARIDRNYGGRDQSFHRGHIAIGWDPPTDRRYTKAERGDDLASAATKSVLEATGEMIEPQVPWEAEYGPATFTCRGDTKLAPRWEITWWKPFGPSAYATIKQVGGEVLAGGVVLLKRTVVDDIAIKLATEACLLPEQHKYHCELIDNITPQLIILGRPLMAIIATVKTDISYEPVFWPALRYIAAWLGSRVDFAVTNFADDELDDVLDDAVIVQIGDKYKHVTKWYGRAPTWKGSWSEVDICEMWSLLFRDILKMQRVAVQEETRIAYNRYVQAAIETLRPLTGFMVRALDEKGWDSAPLLYINRYLGQQAIPNETIEAAKLQVDRVIIHARAAALQTGVLPATQEWEVNDGAQDWFNERASMNAARKRQSETLADPDAAVDKLAEGKWNTVPLTAAEMATACGCKPEMKEVRKWISEIALSPIGKKWLVCYSNIPHPHIVTKLKQIDADKLRAQAEKEKRDNKVLPPKVGDMMAGGEVNHGRWTGAEGGNPTRTDP